MSFPFDTPIITVRNTILIIIKLNKRIINIILLSQSDSDSRIDFNFHSVKRFCCSKAYIKLIG